MQIRPALAAAAAVALFVPQALAQFDGERVTLLSHLSLADFGAQIQNGNDCWGWTTPSGREYAIMGLSHTAAFVEITEPTQPRIVVQVPHSASLWAAIKTYQGYAYVGNESGGGVQVIDIRNIDNDQVTLVRSLTMNSLSTTHTIGCNEESGYLYLAGSNYNGNRCCAGLVAFNLADPSNPVFAGRWNGPYVHEATVITYHEGPYSGREIAFCCCGGAGVYIVDVTNKANMFTLGSLQYPGLQYCHQGWPSEDRRWFYIDDELDEINHTTPVTRTIVVDIANLSTPTYHGSFSNGTTCVDHNLYVKGRFIFESNYTSGLRIFDARNPTQPTEVGYYDTYPSRHEGNDFEGDWSNYPYFPSGTVIIGDINSGLFVVDVSEALACLAADFNADGFINGLDFDAYVAAFEAGEADSDFDEDGFVTGLDFDAFVAAFETGC